VLSHCRHRCYRNTVRKNIAMQGIPWNYKIIFEYCWVGSESLCTCINQLASRNMFLNQSSILFLKLSRVGCSFLIRICFWIIQLWMNVFIACSVKCLLIIYGLLFNLLIKRILLILYFVSNYTIVFYYSK
jgi:hypothetical protein